MGLVAQVSSDLIAALKHHEELKLSVLRMLKAEFQKAQADKGRAQELTEDEAQALVRRLVKQRKESAEQYDAAGAHDRAQAELDETKVLEVYLPAQLGEAELDAMVKTAAEKSGASTPKDMGKLMGALMPMVAGRADGKVVKEKVTAFLASHK